MARLKKIRQVHLNLFEKGRVKSLFLQAVLLAAGTSVLLPQLVQADPCPTCPKRGPGLDPYSTGNSYNPLAAPSLQGGTNTTTLQAGTGSTTLQVGTEQTLLQTGTTGTLLQANVQRDSNPVSILFLIDSSNSMREKIPGTAGDKDPKMEAAKKVLQEAISRIPNDVSLGLRVFGNSFRGDFSDCQQSTLLVPIQKNNRRAIIEAARGMMPYGLTPLTYALMQAEQDLRYIQGQKTVILISDGAETCGGDPCAYIDRLSRIGVKMKIDIVGLGLRKDKGAQEQLNCIAQKSGGKYYDANSSGELIDSITNSVKQAISGKVIIRLDSPKILDGVPADFALPGDKPASVKPVSPIKPETEETKTQLKMDKKPDEKLPGKRIPLDENP